MITLSLSPIAIFVCLRMHFWVQKNWEEQLTAIYSMCCGDVCSPLGFPDSQTHISRKWPLGAKVISSQKPPGGPALNVAHLSYSIWRYSVDGYVYCTC